jgi:hypothetical protein
MFGSAEDRMGRKRAVAHIGERFGIDDVIVGRAAGQHVEPSQQLSFVTGARSRITRSWNCVDIVMLACHQLNARVRGKAGMSEFGKALAALWPSCALSMALVVSACDQKNETQKGGGNAPGMAQNAAPASIPMGGNKSVTRFFITSKGLDKGGDLGGLAGADAHCQALAQAQGAGDHTWRAYLSTEATETTPAVNARDRIGGGPWYNGEGDLIAQHLAQLHGVMSKLGKETAITEGADPVNAELHEILTGSRPDGTAFTGSLHRTCGNWTSSSTGSAQVGYFDRAGPGESPNSWNSARTTNGCSEEAFHSSGGGGLFYCFALD